MPRCPVLDGGTCLPVVFFFFGVVNNITTIIIINKTTTTIINIKGSLVIESRISGFVVKEPLSFPLLATFKLTVKLLFSLVAETKVGFTFKSDTLN